MTVEVLSELQQKWREAAAAPLGRSEWRAVRIAVTGALGFFAAIRERDGCLVLMLETDLAVAPNSTPTFEADGVSLSDERLSDSRRYRLAVTLERNEFLEIFNVLAVDLITTSSAGSDSRAGIKTFIGRLNAWQTCLQMRRKRLGYNSQVGLVGELTILRLLASQNGYPAAVTAWTGPESGLHDYEFNGISIEVKASAGISNRVYISTLDQLQTEGIRQLVIARPQFREDPKGSSVSSLIQEIRHEITRDAAGCTSEFEGKLMKAGYLEIDTAAYQKNRFVLTELYGFEVRAGFPRLTRNAVPAGILDATYVLDEPSILQFRIGKDELLHVARAMS